jgi:asparagine synthase (glutamine-hydrolysing)
MAEALRHESFYEVGTYIDEALGIYVGWAVQKNSFSHGMPLRNERDDVSLIFSGEEFPEPGTILRLRERGHRFDTVKPGYLVHLYEEDSTFPLGLNGRFHGFLTDRTRGRAFLFNDRYGMHRIYYHESETAFYFAAEAKAILEVRPELRTADARGLGEFVACGSVLEDRTLFKGITLLPPAAIWEFRGGSPHTKSTYFRPREWEDQVPLGREDYYHALCDVITRRLPRYFEGPEQVGIALTGGLDTRLIMAWRKAPPSSHPCYTFAGMFRDSRDVRVARNVAEVCQQPHQVIRVGDEFLARFARYAERSVYLTDGSVDVSRSPDLYVSERARDISPVKVVGTYASELLNPVPTFKPRKPLAGLFTEELLPHVDQAETTYTELRRDHPVTFAVFRQSPWWHYGVLSLEQTQLTVRSPYLDNDFVQTVYRAPKTIGVHGDVRLRLISAASPKLRRIRTDRGVGGRPGNPFAAVSRSLLEFTFRAEHAFDTAMPQWLAWIDHVFSPVRLERLFLGRHKPFHFRVWYKGALAEYVQQMLLDSRTLSRPYLHRKRVEAMVRDHLSGIRNYTTEIHRVLTLELLHRRLLNS